MNSSNPTDAWTQGIDVPSIEPLKNPETFKGINPFRKTKKQNNMPESQKPVDFPIEAFPKGIQDIILETFRTLKYPKDFTGTALLYAASVAVGNTLRVEVKNTWIEYSVFYFALVGPSGTMKSPPLSFALKPFHDLDKKSYDEYKLIRKLFNEQSLTSKDKSDSGSKAHEKPVLKKHLVTDITREALSEIHENNPCGIGVYVDELAAWFKNFSRYNNGSDQEFWLSLWSLKPLIVDRVSRGSTFIKYPHIPVIGTIQSKLLYLIAKDDRGANGFIDRVLFAMPAILKKEKWSSEQLNPLTEQRWSAIIDKLLKLSIEVNEQNSEPFKVYKFSNQAYKELEEWQAINADKSNATDDDAIKGIYSKLEIYAIRFCLILHLLECACTSFLPNEIQPSTVAGAIKLIEYFRHTALRVHNIINDKDPLDDLPIKNQELYSALPETFVTKDALRIGREHGFSERTVKRMLNNEDLFRWIRQGQYEKRL